MADDTVANDGMKTPSMRKGPIISAMLLVILNGTSCFSNKPMTKRKMVLGEKHQADKELHTGVSDQNSPWL